MQENLIPRIDGKLFPNVECRKWKCFSHYANKYPQPIETNVCQMGLNFNQFSFANRIKKVSTISNDDLNYSILLDCASTIHFFMSKELVASIEESPQLLFLNTNKDLNFATEKGFLWWNLSMVQLRWLRKCTKSRDVDSRWANCRRLCSSFIYLLLFESEWMDKFWEVRMWFACFNTRDPKLNKPKFTNFTLVQTAEDKNLCVHLKKSIVLKGFDLFALK